MSRTGEIPQPCTPRSLTFRPGCGGRYAPRLHDTESPKIVIRGSFPGRRPGRCIADTGAGLGTATGDLSGTTATAWLSGGGTMVATTVTAATAATAARAAAIASRGAGSSTRRRIGRSTRWYDTAAIPSVTPHRTASSAG